MTEPMHISVTDLAPDHLSALNRAISNILSTDLAVETFAQIVDGMPTRDVHHDYYPRFRDDFENNVEPSQEARQIVQAFQASFSIRVLRIDAQVAQVYQNSPIGTREFILGLMEIVAIICHDVATTLFTNTDGGIHKPDPAAAWPEQLPGEPPLLPVASKPTELYHDQYQDWDQYPKGVADIAGYWAEYRLFGGVVLFDRGESGTECKDVFLHPVRRYRIYQLSEDQIQRFADFILSEQLRPEEISQGLRFQAEKYTRRIDPYDAMSLCIYRNKYERKIPLERPRQCVVRGDDYPEYVDSFMEFAARMEAKYGPPDSRNEQD